MSSSIPLRSTGGQSAEVVLTSALSTVVQVWVDRWRADRPGEHARTYAEGRQFMGALPWLTQETGLSSRRLYTILNSETHVTSLAIADTLLTAIGEQWRLSPRISPSDGGITVIPNPSWSQEYWQQWMKERGGCEDE